MKRSVLLKIMVAAMLFSPASCTDGSRPVPGDQKNYSPAVLQKNRMMRQFVESNPHRVILKYAQADLNDDGLEDLIVIYRVAKGQNEMIVLFQHGSDIVLSNPVPAPVSDQSIQFRNIDDKPPLEFILQGRKGSKVGYAIFRLEDGKLADLFGEGMEDCC